MVIKYKVSDVAKDFKMTSKEIIAAVAVMGGEPKKTASALSEEELNFLFDYLTKQSAKESLKDVIKPSEEKAATAAPAAPATKAEKSAPQANAMPKKEKPPKKDAAPKPVRVTKTVDTRKVEVNLDKYNDKYDNLANTSAPKVNDFQKKQKLGKRNDRRGQYGNRNRESDADKLRRIQVQLQKERQLEVLIPDEITVVELALRLKKTAADVIKKLMLMGVMVTQNDVIDHDTAAMISMEYGAKVTKEVTVTIEERLIDQSDDNEGDLEGRPPVVVVMGHVDHGKTSILDAIRNANVTAGEAGGITQHIGAYQIRQGENLITFLDTPGHAAFTAMRARGASVTDVAVLVVAADDGIMPQTIEAINHAKAAGVSIIVAINKMDKAEANPDRVKQELTEHELVPEEWGGDVICVPVSAITKEGIDTLIEMILLVSEVKELKANPKRLAKGTVIEAKLDKGRGPVATILVQNGTLKSGDIIVAGAAVGRVRVMTDDKGRTLKTAGPSRPVEITGLSEVPAAGDIFNAVSDERLARELVEERKQKAKEEQFGAYQKVTLDNLFSQIAQGEIKELPIIIKGDVQGSVEALKSSLEKLTNDEVRVRVIHGGVGAVSETDIMLAGTSKAIVVGFNVRPDAVAKQVADENGVDLRLYRVIYDCINEVESAMKGMLAPKFRDVELGSAEVRQVYKISNVGIVSGSYITNGKIQRNANVRVVRDGIVVAEDKIDTVRRFKDDVREVAQGYECGITLAKFNDIKEGDIFECYIIEEYRD